LLLAAISDIFPPGCRASPAITSGKGDSVQNKVCRLVAMALLTTSLSVAAGAQSIKTLISFPEPVVGIAVDYVASVVYAVVPSIDGTPNDNLAVIDGNQDVLVKEIAVPSGAQFVAVDSFTHRVFVAGCNFNLIPAPCTVTVIDGKKGTTVSTIAVTSTPGFGLTGITANWLTGLVYVANGSDNVINVIDGYKAKLLTSIDLQGNSPFAIAMNPILGLIYTPFGSNLTGVSEILNQKLLGTINYGADTSAPRSTFSTARSTSLIQSPDPQRRASLGWRVGPWPTSPSTMRRSASMSIPSRSWSLLPAPRSIPSMSLTHPRTRSKP
jgi:hypothetical protein